ncbi:hypothetical protein BJP41_08660 [Candidatus Williamhamiltonella defendens]|uniref:Excisionase n=1 Tax=Candidatus Williamhamiltonella defendens TaxID=138072 RepID=A0A2D3T3L3_9ENTR|nr:excisionase [Candidatus Hamiltonella defensa]ATW30376.1 hypothetical protein BJP41_08660 [Candidatus Hamiltonella defensa]ATW32389.1 hypothetical protein BJP42_08965 [Candidatus Hamiltonella defensa]
MEITLKEWNQKQPRPRCIEQVRRWVRAGIIYPAPRLDGREYLVQANAIKINPLSVKHHTSHWTNPHGKNTWPAKEKRLIGTCLLICTFATTATTAYCYRDPRTGKEYGLGKEKRMAINEAISANRQIFDAPVSLNDRINEVKTLSMTEWMEQFTKK